MLSFNAGNNKGKVISFSPCIDKKRIANMTLTNAKVYKSNAITSAGFRLSVAEQRVILSCIGQIQRNEKVTDLVRYSVSASELSELTGASIPSSFRDLKRVVNRLFDRYVTITEAPNGNGSLTQTLKTRWVQSITFIKDEGRVELRFGKDILPYLNKFSEQFVTYELKNVSNLKSSYSFRFYEILMQWITKGRKEFSLCWLRDVLQMEGRYKTIKDFKKYVLTPAITDINKHSNIRVEWSQKKTGRKVTHLIFEFSLKEGKKTGGSIQKILPGKKLFGVGKNIIEAQAKVGESYEQAALRIKREGTKEPA